MIYNKGVSMRNEAYEKGQRVGYFETTKMITRLKKMPEYAYLKELDTVALYQTLKDLDQGFINFYQKRGRVPQYKKMHTGGMSYRTLNSHNRIRIEGKYIRIPKLGYLRIQQSMEVGTIRNVAVEKTPTGKYFVALIVEFEPKKRRNMGDKIGIDVGIKDFYADSNGNIIKNPKYMEATMKKIVREQRRLSRKKEGSKNYEKQRRKLAGVHEKVVNQRNDFLQKQSTKIVLENQMICIEDLQITEMLRKHWFSQGISSAAWSKFFKMLDYKSSWYGNQVIRVPTFYPSSQTCSACGYRNPLVKKLSVREWECPNCHAKLSRDINAGLNILNKGLMMSAENKK